MCSQNLRLQTKLEAIRFEFFMNEIKVGVYLNSNEILSSLKKG